MPSNQSTQDGGAAVFAIVTATALIAHQVAGKATRDGMFLMHYAVSSLPRIVIATAVLSIVGVLIMSRLIAVHGPLKTVPRAFAVSALLFVAEWVVAGMAAPAAAAILYLHMGVFSALLISGFWSVVNERFDPHTAKRTIAKIAAAATLGGLIGGFVAGRVAGEDVRLMLLVLALLHAFSAFTVSRIGAGARAARGFEVRSALKVLAGSRYLLTIGLLMVIAATTATVLDYALKSEAAAHYDKGEDLIGFFATFYAVVGALTFALQSLFGGRALQRLGLTGTMAMLPLAVVLGGINCLLLPRFISVAGLRAAEAMFANSFFRAGFELLYTPVAPEDKRPTKTIIDVASNRLGDLVGGGLLLVLVAAIPHPPVWIVIAWAVAFAVIAIAVIAHLNRGYVAQLAGSLREGVVSPETVEAVDATTRRILAEWSPAAEREMLARRIADRREGQSAAEGIASLPAARAPGPGWKAALVADLTSGDLSRARRALHSEHLDRSLTPYLIDLLADRDLADDARLELRWLVPRIVGQLTDALLDPDTPVVIRQRLPSVLEVYHNPRAVEGLVQGLEDPVFHVRYGCARALARMLRRSRDLRVEEQRVHAAVLREVEIDGDTWAAQGLLPPQDFDDAAAGVSAPVGLSLQHVFTLLGLALDQDAMNLAMHAVSSHDRAVRGTALEYLENVLPVEVRRGLWRHIGIQETAPRTGRSSGEILEELARLWPAVRGERRTADR
ncbi:MAG: Npt1/Npt2 family nucleotide transporter [Gammaproteobacteria bacterium]